MYRVPVRSLVSSRQVAFSALLIVNLINHHSMQERKRVAIIGSGCSGIGALWALKSTNHEVHLYEKEDRLGGHTNTVTWKRGNQITNVDTGFIVMNSATYRSPPK